MSTLRHSINVGKFVCETLTKPESHDTDKKVTASALRLLESRLSYMHETHSPTVDLDDLGFTWYCDGRTAAAWTATTGPVLRMSSIIASTVRHAISAGTASIDCDIPQPTSPLYGGDMFPVSKTKSVRVSARIENVDGDEQILKACYAENSDGPVITVDAWRERLAAQWDISLEEIRHKISC
ncbi:hypothetical protein IFM47457_03933 [Aspergillus lentulus]|nr:hypothetical protein IFM47457_03933 [Aspergillus lentulus]